MLGFLCACSIQVGITGRWLRNGSVQQRKKNGCPWTGTLWEVTGTYDYEGKKQGKIGKNGGLWALQFPWQKTERTQKRDWSADKMQPRSDWCKNHQWMTWRLMLMRVWMKNKWTTGSGVTKISLEKLWDLSLSHGDRNILTKHNEKRFSDWRPTALLRRGKWLKRKKKSHMYIRKKYLSGGSR